MSALELPTCDRTATQIAARANVARSTLTRIRSNEVSPTVDTLQEIALAMGYEARVNFVEPGDPYATQGALLLVGDEDYRPDDEERAARWAERLQRYCADSLNPALDWVLEAGKYASPLNQERAIVIDKGWDDKALASAGEWAGGAWALSGAAGLRVGGHAIAGTNVLYTADPARARAALTNRPARRGRTVLVKAMIADFHDSWVADGLTYVAPLHIMIDCLGLEDRLAEIARLELEGWLTE